MFNFEEKNTIDSVHWAVLTFSWETHLKHWKNAMIKISLSSFDNWWQKYFLHKNMTWRTDADSLLWRSLSLSLFSANLQNLIKQITYVKRASSLSSFLWLLTYWTFSTHALSVKQKGIASWNMNIVVVEDTCHPLVGLSVAWYYNNEVFTTALLYLIIAHLNPQ